MKKYYEDYIAELEKENKRLKGAEFEMEDLQNKKRNLSLQIEELHQ